MAKASLSGAAITGARDAGGVGTDRQARYGVGRAERDRPLRDEDAHQREGDNQAARCLAARVARNRLENIEFLRIVEIGDSLG